ncbi:hypothetical protein E6P97_03835 [Patescibacteria group bacterium]|nr:MAG: hypothetical protein E6P97_03835 [Patescibacteria group bacterium]
MSNSNLYVEKLGSSLLANEQGLDTVRVEQYVDGFVERYMLDSGSLRKGLIVTTSGATAVGRCVDRMLGYDGETLIDEQYAGQGFAYTFAGWQDAFARHGIRTVTTGLTHHQLGGGRWYHRLANRSERRLFQGIAHLNTERGVVMIVNEPDMVSNTEQMRLRTGGDNDGLGGVLAEAVGADGYTIRTERGGVFDDGEGLVDIINRQNYRETMRMLAGRGKSEAGRGGMDTKVAAGWRTAQAGVSHVAISAVSHDMSLQNATRFVVG